MVTDNQAPGAGPEGSRKRGAYHYWVIENPFFTILPALETVYPRFSNQLNRIFRHF